MSEEAVDNLIKRLRLIARSVGTPPPIARAAQEAADKLESLRGFAKWQTPDDVPGVLPEVLAARVLGLSYGDPGPLLPETYCRQCWGDRLVWHGNAWGARHIGCDVHNCTHECHKNEAWIGYAP